MRAPSWVSPPVVILPLTVLRRLDCARSLTFSGRDRGGYFANSFLRCSSLFFALNSFHSAMQSSQHMPIL